MKSRNRQRRGFTIIELLVVVSIMAVIATLATGAAIKSVKQSRNKRIDVMAKALEASLVNYRALYGEWPFELSQLVEDGSKNPDYRKKIYWLHGKNNFKAFKNVLSGPAKGSKVVLLDTSSLITWVQGSSMMTVKKALEKNYSDLPMGFIDPNDTSRIGYFCLMYRKETESVKIIRCDATKHTDDRHPEDDRFLCPEYKK